MTGETPAQEGGRGSGEERRDGHGAGGKGRVGIHGARSHVEKVGLLWVGWGI